MSWSMQAVASLGLWWETGLCRDAVRFVAGFSRTDSFRIAFGASTLVPILEQGLILRELAHLFLGAILRLVRLAETGSVGIVDGRRLAD
jgi:hypothetical protein